MGECCKELLAHFWCQVTCYILNGIIPVLTEAFCCPEKDEMGLQIIPFSTASVLFASYMEILSQYANFEAVLW
jgi:hypothetical protein